MDDIARSANAVVLIAGTEPGAKDPTIHVRRNRPSDSRTYDRCRIDSITEVAPDAARVEFSGLDPRAITPGFVNHVIVPGYYLHGPNLSPITVGEIIEVSHFGMPEVVRRHGSELVWIIGAGVSHSA